MADDLCEALTVTTRPLDVSNSIMAAHASRKLEPLSSMRKCICRGTGLKNTSQAMGVLFASAPCAANALKQFENFLMG